MAELKCDECGKVWQLDKDIKDISKDDLKCCGKYAEVISSYKGEDNDKEFSLS